MKITFLKLNFLILILLLFIYVSNKSIFGQNLQDKPFIASSGSSGEETVREIEQIAVKAKDSGERLFVIARLGKREKSNRISLAPLLHTQWYLKTRQFPFQDAVFAEGSRVDGEGRIEFYLGSQLRLVTLAKINKIPNLTCCPDYFPTTKRKSRKKLKK